MGENVRKNISKNLSSKYSQKLLDPAKQSPTDGIKTISGRVSQILADATDDLIGNKVADRITKV